MFAGTLFHLGGFFSDFRAYPASAVGVFTDTHRPLLLGPVSIALRGSFWTLKSAFSSVQPFHDAAWAATGAIAGASGASGPSAAGAGTPVPPPIFNAMFVDSSVNVDLPLKMERVVATYGYGGSPLWTRILDKAISGRFKMVYGRSSAEPLDGPAELQRLALTLRQGAPVLTVSPGAWCQLRHGLFDPLTGARILGRTSAPLGDVVVILTSMSLASFAGLCGACPDRAADDDLSPEAVMPGMKLTAVSISDFEKLKHQYAVELLHPMSALLQILPVRLYVAG